MLGVSSEHRQRRFGWDCWGAPFGNSKAFPDNLGGGVKLVRLFLLILRACTAWMRSQRPLIRKDAGEKCVSFCDMLVCSKKIVQNDILFVFVDAVYLGVSRQPAWEKPAQESSGARGEILGQ